LRQKGGIRVARAETLQKSNEILLGEPRYEANVMRFNPDCEFNLLRGNAFAMTGTSRADGWHTAHERLSAPTRGRPRFAVVTIDWG